MVVLPWLLLLAGVVQSAVPRNHNKPKEQEPHFVKPAEQNYANPKPQEANVAKAMKQEPHFVNGKYQPPHLMKGSSKSTSVKHSANAKDKETHYVTSPRKNGLQEAYEWQTVRNDKNPHPKYTDGVYGYADKMQDRQQDSKDGAGDRGPYSSAYFGMLKPGADGRVPEQDYDYNSETVYQGKAGMAEFYKGTPEYSDRKPHDTKSKHDNKNDKKKVHTDKTHYENDYKQRALPPARRQPQARVVPKSPPPHQSAIPAYPPRYPPTPFLPFGYHPFLAGYPYFAYPYSFAYPGYRFPYPAPVAPVAPAAPAPTPENNKHESSRKFRCPSDGYFYREPASFFQCFDGDYSVQFCAPGSINYEASYYSKAPEHDMMEFCAVNMATFSTYAHPGAAYPHPAPPTVYPQTPTYPMYTSMYPSTPFTRSPAPHAAQPKVTPYQPEVTPYQPEVTPYQPEMTSYDNSVEAETSAGKGE